MPQNKKIKRAVPIASSPLETIEEAAPPTINEKQDNTITQAKPIGTLTPPIVDLNSFKHWVNEVNTNEENRFKVYDYLIENDCLETAQKLLLEIENLREKYRNTKSPKEKGELTKKIGDAFELFVSEVFSKCSVFKVVKNVQTTTNELDFVLELTAESSLVPFLRDAGSQIFGEAKCYTSNEVQGNWVSKLSTILDTSNGKLAFLIIANAQGTMKNSQLKRKFDDGVVLKRIILPLGQDFIQQILAGENILTLLELKYNKFTRRELDNYVI